MTEKSAQGQVFITSASCHPLHYLQIATEMFGKAHAWKTEPRFRTHRAIVGFLRSLSTNRAGPATIRIRGQKRGLVVADPREHHPGRARRGLGTGYRSGWAESGVSVAPRQPGGGTRRTRIRPLADAEGYSQGATIPSPSRRSPCDGRSLSLIRTAPDARGVSKAGSRFTCSTTAHQRPSVSRCGTRNGSPRSSPRTATPTRRV